MVNYDEHARTPRWTRQKSKSTHTIMHSIRQQQDLTAVKCKDREKENSPNHRGSTQMRTIILILTGIEFIST